VQIYHYDLLTGIYMGASEARIDPLETKKQDKEVYLMPAHSTIDAPPQAGEHEAPVFHDGAWHIVADYRGEVWWKRDGTQFRIEALDVLPEETDADHNPQPSAYHDFDDGKWVLNRERWLDTDIRPKRNQLLNEADTVHCNADRWEVMLAEQKSAWRTYKKALRDLPGVIDYENPVWPTMPID